MHRLRGIRSIAKNADQCMALFLAVEASRQSYFRFMFLDPVGDNVEREAKNVIPFPQQRPTNKDESLLLVDPFIGDPISGRVEQLEAQGYSRNWKGEWET